MRKRKSGTNPQHKPRNTEYKLLACFLYGTLWNVSQIPLFEWLHKFAHAFFL